MIASDEKSLIISPKDGVIGIYNTHQDLYQKENLSRELQKEDLLEVTNRFKSKLSKYPNWIKTVIE